MFSRGRRQRPGEQVTGEVGKGAKDEVCAGQVAVAKLAVEQRQSVLATRSASPQRTAVPRVRTSIVGKLQ